MLTEKELAVLKGFSNEFTDLDCDDIELINHPTWMFSVLEHSELKKSSFPGVVGSLVSKGYVETDTEGDPSMLGVKMIDTWTMWISQKGFDALQESF